MDHKKALIIDSISRKEARAKAKEIHPDISSGQVVHHLDHNPFNNDISNLAIIDNSDHLWYHRQATIEKPHDKIISSLLTHLEGSLLEWNNYTTYGETREGDSYGLFIKGITTETTQKIKDVSIERRDNIKGANIGSVER